MPDKSRTSDKVRLDKWLWAARFFKTRSLAKAAIEGGKVHLAGQRVKVSREIAVGDLLNIRQGCARLPDNRMLAANNDRLDIARV
jgi:ribosome-associated heat shock protein Hsp15